METSLNGPAPPPAFFSKQYGKYFVGRFTWNMNISIFAGVKLWNNRSNIALIKRSAIPYSSHCICVYCGCRGF